MECNAKIKAIDSQSVHRICSGQVVLSLAIAVKELLENALDAGASKIDIKLKGYGLDMIEVSDNGSGIEATDFETIALKHYTSKLSKFEDLESVMTLGFRGEALSSLCAVRCWLTKYDEEGQLQTQTPCPREQGSTVVVEHLFKTLPVRMQEFKRNMKREFNKMLQLLQAYCVFRPDVAFRCTHQIDQSKSKSDVIRTSGSNSIKLALNQTLGNSQVKMMTPLLEGSDSEETEAEGPIFRFQGYISKPIQGHGKGSSDRQYLAVNSRPCINKKIAKCINESYRQYNKTQYPAFVINIQMDRTFADVNVTPDKRTILIQEEQKMIDELMLCIMRTFEPHVGTYLLNNTLEYLPASEDTPIKAKAHQSTPLSQRGSSSSSTPVSRRRSSQRDVKIDDFMTQVSASLSSKHVSPLQEGVEMDDSDDGPHDQELSAADKMQLQQEQQLLLDQADESESEAVSITSTSKRVARAGTSQYVCSVLGCTSFRRDMKTKDMLKKHYEEQHSKWILPVFDGDDEEEEEEKEEEEEEAGESEGKGRKEAPQLAGSCRAPSNKKMTKSRDVGKSTISDNLIMDVVSNHNEDGTPEDSAKPCPKKAKRNQSKPDKHVPLIAESIAEYEEEEEKEKDDAMQCCHAHGSSSTEKGYGDLPLVLTDEHVHVQQPRDVRRARPSGRKVSVSSFEPSRLLSSNAFASAKRSKARFMAKISPKSNATAEAELSREISKEAFGQMKVIGQFNLGFIIAQLNNDIFIVDQHATDEKYNFERLCKTTKIQSQQLLVPKKLELSIVQEMTLIDNIDIFKANGFDFSVTTSAPPMHKVKLTKIPCSKNVEFGQNDIDEMLCLLNERPGVFVRPSRVRSMLASRACRSSVMVGKHLSSGEMKSLLNHMGEIDQPWNCPHGRPTMRHLVDLTRLKDSPN